VPARRVFLVFWLVLFVCTDLCAQATSSPAGAQPAYKLGPGDRVYITVFNQEDLTGEFVLDGEGRISMPLIGAVQATGLTQVELEALVVSKLKPDYLVNPRVSVDVQSYRPYYLIGEVRSTGSFPYVEGMTYLTAIAMAGGYSYRAKKDIVFVIRGSDPDQEEVKLDVNERVHPGDIIRVAERLF
jgi:polysaccharide export outer membrane protein